MKTLHMTHWLEALSLANIDLLTEKNAILCKSGLSTRIFQPAPTMSHAAHFADSLFPKPWRLKRLLGAAGAALRVSWLEKGYP
jgi:hypothetical protein